MAIVIQGYRKAPNMDHLVLYHVEKIEEALWNLQEYYDLGAHE